MEKQYSSQVIEQPVRIHLIGKFRTYNIDGIDITPTATKARCLLAILVLENSGTVSRDKICQLLWGRHAHEQARASLRQSLSVLRRTFNTVSPKLISADRNNIHIQLDQLWIDTWSITDNVAEQSSLLMNYDGEVLENLSTNEPKFTQWLTTKKQSLQKEIKNAQAKQASVIIRQEALNVTSPSKTLTHQQDTHSNHRTDTGTTTKQSRDSNQSRYRITLMKKIKEFWIDGLLEHSLILKTSIELALKEEPDQIHQPWKGIIPQPHHEPRLFPANTPIIDIFEELDESLLILGSPGSGKTTLLLNLAKKQLERAEENKNRPVPVVLHLSTWNNQYTNLRDWLIDELENRYQMPRKLNAEAIDNRMLLLLLDGLDEVDVNQREHCVEAINKFQNQSMPVPMAMCSRESDYTAVTQQLALINAVVIQPINPEQLDNYLRTISSSAHGLNTAIMHNNDIRNLLTTPLMLNIATTAYQNYHDDALKGQTKTTAQDQLFSTYLQAMFQHRKKDHSYSPEETTHWLGCLARTLIDKKQSLFYLEGIQPDWAGTALQRWIVSKGSIYICGIIVTLTLSLLAWQLLGISSSLILLWIIAIAGCYLTARWGYGDIIKPIANIRLSLDTLRHKFFFKLISSAILATIFGSGAALLLDPVLSITLGTFFFVLLIMTNSLDFEPAKHRQFQPTVSNEAMHGSLHNALVGLVSGFVLGTTIGLFTSNLPSAIFIGFTLGTISGLFFGGHACIQHYLLRYFFWRNKTAPLRYTPFLEFAVKHAFLYRVGGGYLFIHRSLAEYFAKNQQYHRHTL